MYAFRNKIVGFLLAVFMGVGLISLSGAPSASASTSGNLQRAKEAVNCGVIKGFSCAHVKDAHDWALGVTAWRFGNKVHADNMGDAFRHCIWIGALATRFGQSDAYWIGHVHEEKDPYNTPAQYAMDDWNNWVGSQIGTRAVSSGAEDEWGYVMDKCEAQAKAYELYGLDGIKGNYEK